MEKKSGNQTKFGKGFEYACVKALFEKYSMSQNVEIIHDDAMRTAKKSFIQVVDHAPFLLDAANAAIRQIDRLEPRLRHPEADFPLILSIQTDAKGKQGDVRDVLCIRRQHHWEIGFSCKHNHAAVKHSRLSDTIDFGQIWFEHPCSQQYFEEIRPIFNELKILKISGQERGVPILWDSIENKIGKFYQPILNAFINELNRLSSQYNDIPKKLIKYLLGKEDFYKIITDDKRKVTRVIAFNINGTLNQISDGVKPLTTVPLLQLPSKFHHIGFKESSKSNQHTTIEIICDKGWQLSLRLHSAKKDVEPSLKFDVQMISFPQNIYVHDEPWDNL